ALWLFFSPPERLSTTTTVPSVSQQGIGVSKTVSTAEPSSVVVLMLTAGMVAVMYGINGLRLTKFSGGPISAESQFAKTTLTSEHSVASTGSVAVPSPAQLAAPSNRALRTLRGTPSVRQGIGRNK